MSVDTHSPARSAGRQPPVQSGTGGPRWTLTPGVVWRFLVLYPIAVLIIAGLLTTDVVRQDVDLPVNVMTAQLAAWLLNAVGFASVASGVNIAHGGAIVAVKTGCSGLELLGVLLPAMLLFPASARAKLVGIVAAVAVVLPLNALRVASLSLLLATSTRAFDLAHLYFWQAALIGSLFAFFLAWVRTVAWPTPARS